MNARNHVPVSLQREGDAAIVITWNDGVVSKWTAAALRTACPCASCRQQRRGELQEPTQQAEQQPASLPVLSAAEAQPLEIEAMRPVGNYAYSIAFSDGHSSGVFLFDLLRDSPGSL